MSQTFEFFESGIESLTALSRNAQAIADEANSSTVKAYEVGGAALEKLIAAGSLEAALKIQADLARTNYETMVAQTARFSGLFADLARDAARPFESLGPRPR